MAHRPYFRLRPHKRADRRPPKVYRVHPREQSSKEYLRRRFSTRPRTTPPTGRPSQPVGLYKHRTPALVQLGRTRAGYYLEDPPPPRQFFDGIGRVMFDPIGKERDTVCGKRHIRKEVLFAKQIAGYPGRSPGKGGTYRRTPDSETTCERGR